MDLRQLTALQAASKVNAKQLKAVDLFNAALTRCREEEIILNVYSVLAGSKSLDMAARIDDSAEEGGELPLAGVPLAIKEDFMTTDLPSSMGSAAFKSYFSPFNAAAVEKLLSAGAVPVGKTNAADPGSLGALGESSTGPAYDPFRPGQPAGSAGAAALSAGLALLALESDSGGAMRRGAARCGVYALRPTAGLVSRYGLNMAASSFCQVGISAHSAADLSVALGLIQGFDSRDAATKALKNQADAEYLRTGAKNGPAPGGEDVAAAAGSTDLLSRRRSLTVSDSSKPGVAPILAGSSAESLIIGFPRLDDRLIAPAEQALFEKAKAFFAAQGHRLKEVQLPWPEAAVRAYYTIAFAEASSNLSRFDGIRYGAVVDAPDLDGLYGKSRRQIFGEEALRRSLIGTVLLSGENYNRYYRQAMKVWALLKKEYDLLFAEVNLLLLPVNPGLSGQDDSTKIFSAEYAENLFCVPASICGLPALVVPLQQVAKTGKGLPYGVQLMGPAFSEALLFAAAESCSACQGLSGSGMAEGRS